MEHSSTEGHGAYGQGARHTHRVVMVVVLVRSLATGLQADGRGAWGGVVAAVPMQSGLGVPESGRVDGPRGLVHGLAQGGRRIGVDGLGMAGGTDPHRRTVAWVVAQRVHDAMGLPAGTGVVAGTDVVAGAREPDA